MEVDVLGLGPEGNVSGGWWTVDSGGGRIVCGGCACWAVLGVVVWVVVVAGLGGDSLFTARASKVREVMLYGELYGVVW